MKAAVILQPKSFKIQDVPIPEPATGELLVRVMASGICGRLALLKSQQISVEKLIFTPAAAGAIAARGIELIERGSEPVYKVMVLPNG